LSQTRSLRSSLSSSEYIPDTLSRILLIGGVGRWELLSPVMSNPFLG
jgi:hypothetical protein